MNFKALKYITFTSFIFAPTYASAGGSGDHHHGDHHDMAKQHMDGHHMGDHHMEGHGPTIAGRPGSEDEVDRVIKVDANDSMRFVHEPIKVSNGETIKFEITNTGKIKHEFSIGTKDEHKAHSKMMMANPDMHHGPGGSSITLEPGKTETLIWHFEEAWEVQAACNMPGHYQAGMHSDVSFVE
jgi:uncharacterized cupredoxin-like copper-binding protein